MAEALAVTALALAAPPCIRAVIDISREAKVWMKIAGTLRLSSQAQCIVTSSRIFHVINNIRDKLKKGSRVIPTYQVRELVDRLNRTIFLCNDLATDHEIADAKSRLDALQTVEKALNHLLHDVKNLSRLYANKKLTQAVKTGLYYDQKIAFPDGTIAAYHNDNIPLDLSSNLTEANALRTGYNRTEHIPSHLVSVPSASEVSTSPGSPQRMFVPADLAFHPWAHSAQLRSSTSSTGVDLLGASAEDGMPLVDLHPVKEVIPHLEGSNFHSQPAEFFLIDFSTSQLGSVASTNAGNIETHIFSS